MDADKLLTVENSLENLADKISFLEDFFAGLEPVEMSEDGQHGLYLILEGIDEGLRETIGFISEFRQNE